MASSRRICRKSIAAAILMLAATAHRGAFAQSTAFTYQGQLKQNGQPYSGPPANMIFSLYSVASGGSPLGTQTINGVSISNGLFTVTLNGASEFGSTAFDGTRRWLEIGVNGTLMSSRQEVTAAPYALRAAAVTLPLNATVSVNGPAVNIHNGATIGLLAHTGGVGYGTYGYNSQDGGVGALGQGNGTNGIGVYGLASASGTTYGVYGQVSSITGYAGYFDGGRNYFSGNLGLGVLNPTAKLDIGGVAGSDGIRFPDGTLQTTAAAAGPGTPNYWTLSGSNNLYNNSGNNVGIGTSSPGTKLDVAGTTRTTAFVLPTGAGTNKVLTSDASGNATWQTPVSGGTNYWSQSANPNDIYNSNTGNVGIGTNTPGAKLDVNGTTRVTAFALPTGAANGRVLTSDAAGNATWQTPSGGGGSLPLPFSGGASVPTFGQAVFAVSNTASGASNYGSGVLGSSGSVDYGAGVRGYATATSGQSYGVQGESISPGGIGVNGFASANSGVNFGVVGLTNSPIGYGVYGSAPQGGSQNYGVYGTSASTNGLGMFGRATANTGLTYGVLGQSDSQTGWGVFGFASSPSGLNYGIYGLSNSPSGYGGYFANNDPGGVALWVNGTARVKALEITGADVAERFPTCDEKPEPGTVMEIDADNPGRLRIARGAYNTRVAGVVSGAGDIPVGAVLGNMEGQKDSPAIALTGRVWVKCDAGQHAIAPGDLLTTSSTDGHAMKADPDRARGAILGKAMTRLSRGNKGLVLVLVSLQ